MIRVAWKNIPDSLVKQSRMACGKMSRLLALASPCLLHSWGIAQYQESTATGTTPAGAPHYEVGLKLLLDASGNKDLPAATEAFKKAAAENDPRALNILGLIHDPVWKIGTETNVDEAARYYSAASGLGFEAARFNLENLLERGLLSQERATELTKLTSATALTQQTREAEKSLAPAAPSVLSSKEIFQRVGPAVVELKTASNYGSGVILGSLTMNQNNASAAGSTLELVASDKSYTIRLGFDMPKVPLARTTNNESFLFIVTNSHVVSHVARMGAGAARGLGSSPQSTDLAQNEEPALKVGIGLRGEGESWQVAAAHAVCLSIVPQQDLAFVLVKDDAITAETRSKMNPAKLYAEPNAPEKGSQVYAIGNPEGLSRSIAQGLYNGLRPEGLQFDAPISVGSSGGALISENGELLGITTGFVANKDSQNLNFALPSFEIIQNLRLGQSTCQTL